MTPERFQQIDRLVSLALQRNEAEREAFVAEACKEDHELRAEVESLLGSHQRLGSFLVEPPQTIAAEAVVAQQTLPAAGDAATMLGSAPAFGRFVITGELGRGGMGVVYAAHDPELGRQVAIKVMRPGDREGMSASEGRARIVREAQAMAKLAHPNVLSVYDVGTVGDQVFIVMEHVDGSTLGTWLSQAARSWREVLGMFLQAGRGLAAAHAAEILHRDFKPENVLVGKDGRARVMDFGLARAAQPLNGRDDFAPDAPTLAPTGRPQDTMPLGIALTETGKFLGTPAYVAPEQLQGQRASEKTDQFSFCVALYQGLYGKLPFEGETIASVLSQMKQGKVKPPSKSSSVPTEVRQIVLQGLAFNPAERHPTIDALLDQLDRHRTPAQPRRLLAGSVWILVGIVISLGLFRIWTDVRSKTKSASIRIPSIAVLPLENLTGDDSQEYFVDGMTEALISDLARMSTLQVISRTSVMNYKRAKKPIPEIAKELGVDAVVEGSVARSANRVRVTAKLVDGKSDRSLLAKDYERELSDILQLQHEIARAVAVEISGKLNPQDEVHLTSKQTLNPQLYEAYLQGRFFWNKRTEQDITKGMDYFREALKRDPNYAPAWAGLADCYHFLNVPVPVLSPGEALRLSKAAALKATSLDDSLGEAHATLGWLAFRFEWNWSTAEREFKRAIELSPSYIYARIWYGHYLSTMRRKEEARAEYQRAVKLDPLSNDAYRNLGLWFLRAKQYDEAIELFQKAINLDSFVYMNYVDLADAYQHKGMFDDAIEIHRKALEVSGRKRPGIKVAQVYALAGQRAKAEEILREYELQPWGDGVAVWMAATYAAIGRKEQAFRWLERGYQTRQPMMVQIGEEQSLDSLRSDPRFQDLIRRIGLPE